MKLDMFIEENKRLEEELNQKEATKIHMFEESPSKPDEKFSFSDNVQRSNKDLLADQDDEIQRKQPPEFNENNHPESINKDSPKLQPDIDDKIDSKGEQDLNVQEEEKLDIFDQESPYKDITDPDMYDYPLQIPPQIKEKYVQKPLNIESKINSEEQGFSDFDNKKEKSDEPNKPELEKKEIIKTPEKELSPQQDIDNIDNFVNADLNKEEVKDTNNKISYKDHIRQIFEK
jgi:hypothetical protein